MKFKNAFKCAVLIAIVLCLIAAMIYSGQREKLTAIYYMCISIILFLIYKNC